MGKGGWEIGHHLYFSGGGSGEGEEDCSLQESKRKNEAVQADELEKTQHKKGGGWKGGGGGSLTESS